jgi:hypothetical protein
MEILAKRGVPRSALIQELFIARGLLLYRSRLKKSAPFASFSDCFGVNRRTFRKIIVNLQTLAKQCEAINESFFKSGGQILWQGSDDQLNLLRSSFADIVRAEVCWLESLDHTFLWERAQLSVGNKTKEEIAGSQIVSPKDVAQLHDETQKMIAAKKVGATDDPSNLSNAMKTNPELARLLSEAQARGRDRKPARLRPAPKLRTFVENHIVEFVDRRSGQPHIREVVSLLAFLYRFVRMNDVFVGEEVLGKQYRRSGHNLAKTGGSLSGQVSAENSN